MPGTLTPTELERQEYDRYLGVFYVLGSLVTAASAVYLAASAFGGVEPAPAYYPFITIGAAMLSTFCPGLFRGEKYPKFDDSAPDRIISIAAKKRAILVAFTLYLISITALTFWTGGAKASPFASMVPFTASLCVYVAKRRGTKLFVGVVTWLSYVLVSFWHFDPEKQLVVQSLLDFEFFLEVITVATVVLISAFLSKLNIEPGKEPVTAPVH